MTLYWYTGKRIVFLSLFFGLCGALIAALANWNNWVIFGMACLGVVIGFVVSFISWNRWVDNWGGSLNKSRT